MVKGIEGNNVQRLQIDRLIISARWQSALPRYHFVFVMIFYIFSAMRWAAICHTMRFPSRLVIFPVPTAFSWGIICRPGLCGGHAAMSYYRPHTWGWGRDMRTGTAHRKQIHTIEIGTAEISVAMQRLSGHRRHKIDYVPLGRPHHRIDGLRRIAAWLWPQ